MASKSLTALPSVVSVVAEKTVVAMRCHTRGFEKVFWPIISIILTSLTLICFAIAAGTPMWVQIRLYDNTNQADPDRGYINFGIFSGSHVIELQQSTIANDDEDSYFVFERYTTVLITRLYATFVFSLIAMLVCVVLIIVTFLNSYQTVTTWWRGPPMMYILSLTISFCAFTALGLFADFYLWDMDTRQIFLDSSSNDHLLSYQRVPSLHYSFGLQCGASFLPLFVLLISWRLMRLLPLYKDSKEAKAEEEENTQPANGNNTMLPMNQMAMSMQAAAAGPMPHSGLPRRGIRKDSKESSFMNDQGGLFY